MLQREGESSAHEPFGEGAGLGQKLCVASAFHSFFRVLGGWAGTPAPLLEGGAALSFGVRGNFLRRVLDGQTAHEGAVGRARPKRAERLLLFAQTTPRVRQGRLNKEGPTPYGLEGHGGHSFWRRHF